MSWSSTFMATIGFVSTTNYETDNEAELMEENFANDGNGDGDMFGG